MRKIKQYTIWLCFLFVFISYLKAQELQFYLPDFSLKKKILMGDEQIDQYFSLLSGKTVAVVANQTSIIGNTHLVDTLISLKINIKKIFAPEHGFRGDADAGEHIDNGIDAKTGLQIISLYGKHNKPTVTDLKDIDLVVFDIQDVGARFYTYLSTMHYVMEACAENNVAFLILDRPNPNGFYVDGPVMEKKYTSFVGMHPVPIVYGMTMAEYARMINAEGWLKNKNQCNLQWISCKNYTHLDCYQLPIKPSPNLPNANSIYLYPSLCLFEGTVISVGRGTDHPFEMYGSPSLQNMNYKFTPKSIEGLSKHPMYENDLCFGKFLGDYGQSFIRDQRHIQLCWLIDAYKNSSEKNKFFNGFFNQLAGNSTLKEQIIKGKTEDQIRESWQKDLIKFKNIRKKYLLYQDFE